MKQNDAKMVKIDIVNFGEKIQKAKEKIAIGLPLLIFPFDAFKTNCGGGFTDLLQVRAGSVWGEMWSSRAWVRMEPFLHVGLILVLCGLVFEYVGYFADLLVIGC